MKKRCKVIAALPFLALMSGPSLAEKGVYVGLSIGQGSVDLPTTEVLTLLDDGGGAFVNEDDSDTVFDIHVGYQFNEYFAVEGGYANFGEYSLSAVSDGTGSTWFAGDTAVASIDGYGFLLGLKAMAPVSENFTLFAKAGLNMWEAEISASVVSVSLSEDDDGTDAYFGFGATYNINNIGINAGFNRYDVAGGDIEAFTIGADFSLGK